MVGTAEKQGLLGKLGIEVSDSTKKTTRKVVIYGGNIMAHLMYPSKLISNAYGALGFATLDFLIGNSKFKDGKYNRLIKTGGALTYLSMCVYDVALALEGDYTHLENLSFDASMAIQLGTERSELYKKLSSGNSPSKIEVKEDLVAVGRDLKDLFRIKKNIESPKKNLEREVSTNSVVSQKSEIKKYSKIKNYLSNLGKGAVENLGKGFGAGQASANAFGNAFGKYVNHKVDKIKEKIEARKKNKFLDKLSTTSYSEVLFKEKEKVLRHLGENPRFMRKYQINNKYEEFKGKLIDGQIQVMEERQNDLKNDLAQMKSAPWFPRFYYESDIFETKSDLKEIKIILWELDIEKKNPKKIRN